MGLLLAAVVLLLVVFVFGPADGPLGPVDDEHQLRVLGQHRLQIGGLSRWQEQLSAQHRADQGRQTLDPLADLWLAQAEEPRHDLLQGVGLEVKEHEQKLGSGGGQLAGLSARPKRPLAYPAVVPAGQSLLGQELLQTRFQSGELPLVQGSQCPQQPRLAKRHVHVHASTSTRNVCRWLRPIEFIDH